MPNLIPSLDACSLALFVKLLIDDADNIDEESVNKKFIKFDSIHDCYATTINKMGSII
jgi:hypothetical protein